MSIIIVLACSVIGLVVTLRQFRFVTDYPTRLLIFSFWARLSVSAAPEHTAKSFVAGFSLIALTTLGFTGLLLLACRRREFQAPHYALYLPLIAIMLISAGVNTAMKGIITELITWTVFLVTLQVTRMAIDANGLDRSMRALMAPFATPLLLQVASIATNHSIGSEEDGSRGFIGGYIHESVFSRFVMIFLIMAMLVRWRNLGTRTALLLYSVVSIFMSNYRTTILAVLPIAGVVTGSQALAVLRSRYRPAMLIGVAVLAVVVLTFALPLLPPRYAQIFDAAGRLGELFQGPKEFTDAERRIFSNRFFIWSLYLSEYFQGNPMQIVFGLGPYADQGKFHVGHAHNSYVQYLYEYGVFGLFMLFVIIIANLFTCFKIRDVEQRALLVSVHLSFIVLNLSTGVLKSIEGLQLYAIIMAATLAATQRRPQARHPAAARFA
jgi:O-antigen ligase